MRITRPCTEDLDSMARTASGGFACSRCELEVVDLRRASRKRALTVLSELRERGGRVCARVRAKPDGTPIFRSDPSRFARLAGPIALASTLSACAPSPAGPAHGSTPIALHATSSGNNAGARIAPIAPVSVAPVAHPAPIRPASVANVPTPEPVELEMAGEMMY